MDNNTSLASELLSELKRESKRRFILLIICIILLFVSNMSWLIAWNLPSEETVSESYELQGDGDANVFYNEQGEVKINEPSESYENENNQENEQTEKP